LTSADSICSPSSGSRARDVRRRGQHFDPVLGSRAADRERGVEVPGAVVDAG
jgi:hypothetical protein